MAEPDRLVAALRYQQELEEAQRPATMNPNMAAQGNRLRNRFAAALPNQSGNWSGEALPMEGRATFLPFQDTLPGSVMNKRSLALPGIVAGAVNAFTAPGRALSGSDPTFNPEEEAANLAMNVMGGGIGASRGAPAPAGSLGMNVVAKRAFTAPQDEVPQLAQQLANFVNTTNLPNQGRDLIRSKADELSTMLNQQGFQTDVKHSGSAAGPSSYVTVYDPQTGRYITDPARISGHSKGAFNSQFSHNISDDPQSMQKFVDLAMEMRAKGPSEMMKQQHVVEQAVIEMRYKNAQKKIAKGKTLTKSEQEAVALKSAPDLLAEENR